MKRRIRSLDQIHLSVQLLFRTATHVMAQTKGYGEALLSDNPAEDVIKCGILALHELRFQDATTFDMTQYEKVEDLIWTHWKKHADLVAKAKEQANDIKEYTYMVEKIFMGQLQLPKLARHIHQLYLQEETNQLN